MPSLLDLKIPNAIITNAKVADNGITTAALANSTVSTGNFGSLDLYSKSLTYPAHKLINVQDVYNYQEASPCSESYNGGAYSNVWNTVRSFNYTPKRSDTKIRFVSTMSYYHSGSSWGATIHRTRVLQGGNQIFYHEWNNGEYSYSNHHNDSTTEWEVASWGAGTQNSFDFQWNPHSGNSNNIIYYHNIRAYEYVDPGLTKGEFQNDTYPHSAQFIDLNSRRADGSGGFGSAYSNSNYGSGFAGHDGHNGSSRFPSIVAIYFGDAYPSGVALNMLKMVLHSNHFGNFLFQGSNDSGKASGFHNNGTWTTLLDANGMGNASNHSDQYVKEYPFFNDTPYLAYRIYVEDIVNRDGTAPGGTYGGWATYGWKLLRV